MRSWPTINASGDLEAERTRARLPTASGSAELRTGMLFLLLFSAGAVWLAWTADGSTPPWGMIAALGVLYAVARLVEFEVGAVFTDCSLLVLAAMLVALPPEALPWSVTLGAALGAWAAAAQGDRHASRM